ncbi:MAG: ROK family glucokinase [Lachnospiraceae bacterium]|nr:ROK family glucokinase [Lachnospiraceae bacterium]
MKNYGFGVDIGGTTCKMGLFKTDGTLVDKWEIPTRTENKGVAILSDVAAAIDAKLEEKNISKDDVQGVGVGVPGPVKTDGTVNGCVNLGWSVFNVADDLGAKVNLPVKVGNDANVAALGEMWMGAGKGRKNVVMVTLGTGVGGGIICDGKMISGANGAGGEIGHMTVNEHETVACNCGKKGCLEQYTSATGIVRLANMKLDETDESTSLRKFDSLTAKDIFDEAKAGDKVANELVEQVCGILGTAMAQIACVADPEVFVIGGGVSKAGTIITDNTKKAYREKAFHACKDAEFVIATLGNDAGIYGCCQLILDV